MPALLVVLLACLLLAGCGGGDDDGGSANTGEAPRIGSIAIDDLGGCGKQPGVDRYRCGSIEVPLERTDSSYGTTEIGFAVLPAERESEGAIFAVEGGPGYPSTGTAQAYRNLFGALLERRDLVLVDQRGQGRSEQYDCPDLQKGLGPESLALANCARALGDAFVSYRTSAAADDVDWVRRALGYETIALYGDSYGTFLGQSYAYRHPEALEALVLDSAYPAFGEDPWYPSLPRTGLSSLDTSCDRSPKCDGDALERLERGVEILRKDGRGTDAIITALIDAAYGPPATYLAIDRAMAALIDGNASQYKNLVAEGKPGAGDQDKYSRAGELVVGCNDYPMVWDVESSEPERREQLEESIESYPDKFAPFTPREIANSPGTSYLECLTWPAPTDVYEPAVDPESAEPTEAPVFVVSGELDDVTTPNEGRVVASFFPDSEHFIAKNAGHVDSLYFADGAAAKRIRAFLRRELG